MPVSRPEISKVGRNQPCIPGLEMFLLPLSSWRIISCYCVSWSTLCPMPLVPYSATLLHGPQVVSMVYMLLLYYSPSSHNCQKCWPMDPQKVQILISITQYVYSWKILVDESKLSFYQLKSPPMIHALCFSPFTHIIFLPTIMPLHLKSYLTIVNKIFVILKAQFMS